MSINLLQYMSLASEWASNCDAGCDRIQIMSINLLQYMSLASE